MILEIVMNSYKETVKVSCNNITVEESIADGRNDAELKAARNDYGFSQGNKIFFHNHNCKKLEISLDTLKADKDVKSALWILMNSMFEQKYKVILLVKLGERQYVEEVLQKVFNGIGSACEAAIKG